MFSFIYLLFIIYHLFFQVFITFSSFYIAKNVN